MTTSEFPIPTEDFSSLLSTALERSATEGARIVALHWLDRLVHARNDWDRAITDATERADEIAARDAAEALHHSRVALRRLRATLREHRHSLHLNVGRVIRQDLRKLGNATNRIRDRDAQREWLEGERESLSTTAREEADTLLHSLGANVATDHTTVSRAFQKYLDPHAVRLAKRLSRYSNAHIVGTPTAIRTFARHLADRVERGGAHLRHDLGMISDVNAQSVLHRVRIRLKRQRAMLAPFAKNDPDIGAWYAMAAHGQKMLGAMRDARLLADKSAKRQLPELAHALHAVALAHYEAFVKSWCHEANSVTRAKAGAVHALRNIRAANALPMEIERKFLLHGLPPEAAVAPSIRIEQGWIPGTAIRERLRRTTHPNGVELCTRTIKLGEPGARIEVEEPADNALFADMWALTSGARIRKRRHLVREGALLWEIDVFLDRDLVLAEVELQDTDQLVDIPAWLAPFVVREVTTELAYLNSVMAATNATPLDYELR